jgi:putative molybdopterin biosynthesis protein
LKTDVKQKIYLRMKTPQEALEILFNRFKPEPINAIEEVSVDEACGRITASPIFAKVSSPDQNLAAMDGVAVLAENTYGATERRPMRLKSGNEAIWINTGQVMPDGKNAVIIAEKLNTVDDDTIEISASAFPWQNVRKVGEDFVVTELLFPQNHLIRAFDLGTLIVGGIFKVEVRKKPRVIIIPTGSELVRFYNINDTFNLKKGQVLESNSFVLSSLTREYGAEVLIGDIIPDTSEAIRDAFLKAADSKPELIISIAGSSAGKKDYTAQTIEEIGELFVHGVTIMPGKPTILGSIKDVPFFGIPGYPVSAYISCNEFVRPFIYRLQGMDEPKDETVDVFISRDMPSKLGIEEFIRVNLGKVGEKTVAIPLPRGAGSVTTLSKAEGIVKIPSESEGMATGEKTRAGLLVNPKYIDSSILVIGSHDMTLDILSDELVKTGQGVRIVSANVGSLGGLLALKNATSHVAGSHLLDTETGEYNMPYIRRYLKGLPVYIFNLVNREQGLIVQKGNPKEVTSIRDLVRDDVVFVNRQKGSGTRVLLDYKLRELNIEPSLINGYENEEYTHMNVAVSVLNGTATAGLGIMAAARALDLDFIPIVQEQYDLVIPSSFIDDPKIQLFLDIARSKSFRERVKEMGGYNPNKSGNLWQII